MFSNGAVISVSDYAFPYIVLVISLMTSAVHMAMFDDQVRFIWTLNNHVSIFYLLIIIKHVYMAFFGIYNGTLSRDC